MKYKQNLHTHTTYGDGIDTPEQMIWHAIDKGFDSLGFSEHSYMFFSPKHCMSEEQTEDYKKEIRCLKTRFENQIKLYLGLEVDMYSKIDLSGYDYLIGSCHYLKLNGSYVGFDRTVDDCRQIIDTYFGGDGLLFATEYYRQLAELPAHGSFDIIGHFDLVTKNNEAGQLFDTESKAYLHAAMEALESLRGKIPFFEVNTGAIARGYRSMPYPSMPLLKKMREMNFGAIISSDCHNGTMLDCGFEEARSMLEACGFKERYILTDVGFSIVPL